MDKVARLPAGDRAALFGETGARRGIANTIIEKDFWVCWTLKRLFGVPKNAAASLVFNGGTSLSKAFGIIRRFSEDIDLSFDRADLGYTGDRDPEQEGISRKKAGQLIDDLVGMSRDTSPPVCFLCPSTWAMFGTRPSMTRHRRSPMASAVRCAAISRRPWNPFSGYRSKIS